MASTQTPPQHPTAPLPPRGSQLWFAAKLSRKKDTLTYSLLTCAAGRLLWITQFHRRGGLKSSPTAAAPQLVVWAIFWPTALVVLSTAAKWADSTVAKSGLERPVEKMPRPEVEGDERKDL
ncbi:hypothetical protein BJ170DRAFT_686900 [Xylariales sp. AK1849]|nr:hypothetical protein BJ170DRAFT_686900 [Xylariales sp. AK1849]